MANSALCSFGNELWLHKEIGDWKIVLVDFKHQSNDIQHQKLWSVHEYQLYIGYYSKPKQSLTYIFVIVKFMKFYIVGSY